MIVRGASRAVEAAKWLKERGWAYSVQVMNNNPFAGLYDFQLNNKEHAMLFKLTWPY